MTAEAEELTFKVTTERIEDCDLEVFYNVKESPHATIEFVAHFMWDEVEDEWMEKSKALRTVTRGRKIKDLRDITDELNQIIEETAFPKE